MAAGFSFVWVWVSISHQGFQAFIYLLHPLFFFAFVLLIYCLRPSVRTHPYMSSVTSKDSNEFQHPPAGIPRGKGVYLSAIVAAIGGFLSGYDTGATSGVLTMEPFVNRFFSPENLAYLQGLMLAFFLMTAALAAFCSGPVCGTCIYIYFYCPLHDGWANFLLHY